MRILDESKIEYDYLNHGLRIDDVHVVQDNRNYYSVLDIDSEFGMKALGRIYFAPASNLKYATGEPVEHAYISGGQVGVEKQYLKPGVQVYTGEQVRHILNSHVYENKDEFKPKLTKEVAMFLQAIADNTAKNKPQKARELLEKHQVVGKED